MLSDSPPTYQDDDYSSSSPTYSENAGHFERVLQSSISSSAGDDRERSFTTEHMSINLRSGVWDLNPPCYGLEGCVMGTVQFSGEQDHVESVTATLEGKITTMSRERGATSGHFVQPLLSRTITLHASHIRPFNWRGECPFSISFPAEIHTRMGVSKLPPTSSTWHPGAHCEVSYALRFEMARKRFRRHESKIIPILYLPKTSPTQSPITILPRPRGDPREMPYPVGDCIHTVKLSPFWPKSVQKPPTHSVYLSLPLPLCFASGESVPFAISLVCPDAPALAQLLAPHIRVKLVKRTRIWVNAGREISVREVQIMTADIWQGTPLAEGINYLKGSIKAGAAGHESSWRVDGVSEVQYILRASITPPKPLEQHFPSFKHDVDIELTTDPWGAIERELRATGGVPTPALALAAVNAERRQSVTAQSVMFL